MRSTLGLVLVATAACGGGSARPDGLINLTDSGNPPPPPGCDYGELHDATNDIDTMNSGGTPEQTLLTYTSGTMVICGSVDVTHYDATNQTVDVDAFGITLAADTEVRIDLTGTGLEAFDFVDVEVNDPASSDNPQPGFGLFLDNHGVADVFLSAGTYDFTMFAGSKAAPTATTAIPYKMRINTYDLESACTQVTAAASHTEGVTDNDVFAIAYPPDGPNMNGLFALTSKLTDAVEPSAITLATTNTSITGSLDGQIAIDMDDYYDRDTFSFTTGLNVNEVTVRVDWVDTTADLDMYMTPVVMPGTTDIPTVTSSAYTGGTGPEINITAVEPSTTYWVWVGAYMASTAPEGYTISICPAQFTPQPDASP